MLIFEKDSEEYSFLWNGTEPGWVLLREIQSLASIHIQFNGIPPSPIEFKALRAAVPAYSACSISEVIATLQEKDCLDLGSFEPTEAARISDRCKAHGLNIVQTRIENVQYIPFNEKTNSALIIDDDQLVKEIWAQALQNGLQVKPLTT